MLADLRLGGVNSDPYPHVRVVGPRASRQAPLQVDRPSAHIIGFDIPGNPYGVADVVSAQFLPFPDESFDLVMCVEGFHYVADPQGGVAEIRRVLRHGGHPLISVPLVWEYDRTVLEPAAVAEVCGEEGDLLLEAAEEPSAIAGRPTHELNYVGLEPWFVLL